MAPRLEPQDLVDRHRGSAKHVEMSIEVMSRSPRGLAALLV